jgi:hypothetical protein
VTYILDYEFDKLKRGLSGVRSFKTMNLHSNDKPSLDELAHFGVKGMKWGVRKAYSERKAKTADRYRRVAEGKGSARDKASVFLRTSSHTIQRAGGFKNAAKLKADRLDAHINRIRNGEAKVKDILEMIGTVSNNDIGMGIYYARQRNKPQLR